MLEERVSLVKVFILFLLSHILVECMQYVMFICKLQSRLNLLVEFTCFCLNSHILWNHGWPCLSSACRWIQYLAHVSNASSLTTVMVKYIYFLLETHC